MSEPLPQAASFGRSRGLLARGEGDRVGRALGKELGPGSQVVHESENTEQRAEPFISGADLVEIGSELLDAEPVGLAVAVGE